MSDYDIEIQYRADIKIDHVDALSRAPTDEPGDTEPTVLDGHFITFSYEEQIIAIKDTDVKLRTIIEVSLVQQ